MPLVFGKTFGFRGFYSIFRKMEGDHPGRPYKLLHFPLTFAPLIITCYKQRMARHDESVLAGLRKLLKQAFLLALLGLVLPACARRSEVVALKQVQQDLELKVTDLERQVADLTAQNRVLAEERALLLKRSEALRNEGAALLKERVAEPASAATPALELSLLEQQLQVLELRREGLERRRSALIGLMTNFAPNSIESRDVFGPVRPGSESEEQFEATPLEPSQANE